MSCWKKDERAQCLRVETGSGEQYLFPYGYFHEARFSTSGDDETLELLFSSGSRVVRIQGSGLEDLWVALQNLSVACVKSLPQRFAPLTKGHACIKSISVENATKEVATRNEPAAAD